MTKAIDTTFDNITIDGSSIPSYTVSASSPWITSGNGVGTSSITWAPNTWTTSDTFTIASPHTKVSQGGKIQLQGDDADIEINGESLVAMLKRIEERINILSVNHDLEAEWEELRELGNRYRELEQHIKDKMKTWKKLQAQDNDNR